MQDFEHQIELMQKISSDADPLEAITEANQLEEESKGDGEEK